MKKREAFTLLELLIVIVIIGILTSVLLLNFQGVKERQELALLQDKSLALLQQTKAEVNSGKVTVDEDGLVWYLCEGGLFTVEEVPQLVAMPSLDGSTCDFSQLSLEDYGTDSGNSYISDIEVEGSNPESVLVLFVPPYGELELYSPSGNSEYDGEAIMRFGSSTFSPSETDQEFVLKASETTDFAQLNLSNEVDDE